MIQRPIPGRRLRQRARWHPAERAAAEPEFPLRRFDQVYRIP